MADDEQPERDPRRIVRGSIAVAIVVGLCLLLAAGGFWWAGAAIAGSTGLAWACAICGVLALAAAGLLRVLDPWRETAGRGAADQALARRLEELGEAGGISAEQLARAREALRDEA